MTRLLDEALAYLRRGWSILPIHAGTHQDKDPHAPLLIRTGYHRPDPERPDRLRATWKPLQTTPPTEAAVRMWFTDPTSKGVALVTGQISGRIVIDFDGDDGRTLAHDLGIRPHVRTGGGGYHWHLRAPPYRVQNLVGKSTSGAPDCIDVRGDGGNAVLPPTCTRKGPYVQLRDLDDTDTVDHVPLPLRETLRLVPPVHPAPPPAPGPLPQGDDRYPADRMLAWALQKVHSGEKGGRNDVGHLLAWALFNNGYAHHEVLQVGQSYVHEVAHLSLPPYTFDEFQASARSAQQAPRGEPWGRRFTRRAGEKTAEPWTPAEALEDVYHHLNPDEQARAAYLLAREWASENRTVEFTVKFLRLIGHQDAPRTVRRAYQDAEVGRPADGTLSGFLSARRVRVPGRATHRRLT